VSTKPIIYIRLCVGPVREFHRVLNGSAFRLVETMDGVLEALFGSLPTGSPPDLEVEKENV
jgi:hypothetical protein